MSERDEKGQFSAGNEAAVTHGAYAVAARIKEGKPLVGLAEDLQAEARADLEKHGALECAKEAVSRHVAGALFAFSALGTTNPDGRLRLLDLFRKFNKEAAEMLLELHELEADRHGDALDYEAVLAAKRSGTDGD